MKITTRGRYGLRLMIELAVRFGKGSVGVRAIAESQGISANYIHVLMSGLKFAGLVKTARGPGGGYELARDPSKITALEIVQALEGPNAPSNCLVDVENCSRTGGCAARGVWRSVAAAIEGALSKANLAELARKENAGREVLLNYHI